MTAAEVPYGAAAPALTATVSTRRRSAVVFSGDTTMSGAVVELATGADIALDEVVSVKGARVIAERIDPGSEALVRH